MAANLRKLPFGRRQPASALHPVDTETVVSCDANVIEVSDDSDGEPKPVKHQKTTDSAVIEIPEPRDEDCELERLRGKCEEEGIPEKFMVLVAKCSEQAGSAVEETKVLRTLLRLHGDVCDTLSHFSKRRR